MSNTGALRQIQNIDDNALNEETALKIKSSFPNVKIKNPKCALSTDENSRKAYGKDSRKTSFKVVPKEQKRKDLKKEIKEGNTKDVEEKEAYKSRLMTANVEVQVELSDECWLAICSGNWLEVEKQNYFRLQQKLHSLNKEILDEENDITDLIDYVKKTVDGGRKRAEEKPIETHQTESSVTKNKEDNNFLNKQEEKSVQTVVSYSEEIEDYPDSYWEAFKSIHNVWMEKGLTEELQLELQYLEREQERLSNSCFKGIAVPEDDKESFEGFSLSYTERAETSIETNK